MVLIVVCLFRSPGTFCDGVSCVIVFENADPFLRVPKRLSRAGATASSSSHYGTSRSWKATALRPRSRAT